MLSISADATKANIMEACQKVWNVKPGARLWIIKYHTHPCLAMAKELRRPTQWSVEPGAKSQILISPEQRPRTFQTDIKFVIGNNNCH